MKTSSYPELTPRLRESLVHAGYRTICFLFDGDHDGEYDHGFLDDHLYSVFSLDTLLKEMVDVVDDMVYCNDTFYSAADLNAAQWDRLGHRLLDKYLPVWTSGRGCVGRIVVDLVTGQIVIDAERRYLVEEPLYITIDMDVVNTVDLIKAKLYNSDVD